MNAMTAFIAGFRVAAGGTRQAEPLARKRILLCALPVSLVLSGCAAVEFPGAADGVPMAFHDTRLQYALLADDRTMLQEDFLVTSPSSVTERAVSALVLPLTAVTETVFYPVAASINGLSGLGSPEPGKTLE